MGASIQVLCGPSPCIIFSFGSMYTCIWWMSLCNVTGLNDFLYCFIKGQVIPTEISETLGLDHIPGLGLDLGLENTHFPGLGLSLEYL